jgi:lipopolysaccharide transport system ATP-binding protein
MDRNEIERKFDEIIDFAGVEKFVDTPVKHYSSGMRLRLGFSVAAHLEPEILVVDEVLAVGDAEFQKKCLGKMKDVAGTGRTVIFVSHDLTAVRNLCTRGILLENGRIIVDDTTETVINHYMRSVVDLSENNTNVDLFKADKRFKIRDIFLVNQNGEPTDYVINGTDIKINISYDTMFKESIHDVQELRLAFRDQNENPLFVCNSFVSSGEYHILEPQGVISCTIPNVPLVEGRYTASLRVKLGKGKGNDVRYDDLFQFEVVDGNFFGTGRKPRSHLGSFLVNHRWEVN